VPFDKVPTYSVRQLESKAGQYLADNFGPDIPIPVDIDLLVERQGIDLDEWPKLQTNHGIEGGVWRDTATGRLFIFIAEELMADESPKGYGRYRMTVAEELAHIHLHRTVIEQIDTPAKFRELQAHKQWAEIERNAKRYAAALLMPGKALSESAERVYAQLVRQAGTDNAAAVKKWLCSLLAREFEVSEMAMHHRLGEWPMKIYSRVEQALHDGLPYLS
jgi:hypothetical protein